MFDFTDHLARVLAVYPDAKVTVEPEGLILLASKTHIAPAICDRFSVSDAKCSALGFDRAER